MWLSFSYFHIQCYDYWKLGGNSGLSGDYSRGWTQPGLGRRTGGMTGRGVLTFQQSFVPISRNFALLVEMSSLSHLTKL